MSMIGGETANPFIPDYPDDLMCDECLHTRIWHDTDGIRERCEGSVEGPCRCARFVPVYVDTSNAPRDRAEAGQP